MTSSSMRLAELRLSLVGAHYGPGGASGHSFGTPAAGTARQHQSRGLDYYDKPRLAARLP
jgi:hypothetical protein